MTSVKFVTVKTNQEKLAAICRIIGQHFYKGDVILIQVATPEVAEYIDQLLWKMPPDSFVPHEKSEDVTDAKIAITTSNKNVNQANILFNLGAGIHPEVDRFEIVYELFDHTHPAKTKSSEERHTHYIKTGLLAI